MSCKEASEPVQTHPYIDLFTNVVSSGRWSKEKVRDCQRRRPWQHLPVSSLLEHALRRRNNTETAGDLEKDNHTIISTCMKPH